MFDDWPSIIHVNKDGFPNCRLGLLSVWFLPFHLHYVNDSNGSGHAGQLFKSAAGKQSLKFRFPDAAIRR